MADERPVPVKTILVTIGLVVATLATLYVVVLLAHIWVLLGVAVFFAVLFTPPVDWVRRHLRVSKGLASFIVLILSLVLLAGLLYAFIRPLVDQTTQFIDNFPQYVSDAKAGKGTVGKLVKRYELDKRIEENRDRLNDTLRGAGGNAVSVARKIFAGILSTLTVVVLAVLMILYGPDLLNGGLGVLSPPKRERVKAVARDSARAITGYAMGNLLISLVAGTVTFFALWAFGVPFKGVLALFVGFTDLIPLVGATLGAIPTIFVAFLHSTTAGIGMVIVYTVYQQFENHVLQVSIMSKTVHINQLVVLVSVLIGVELLGFLGALLAIPMAGVLQVIGRDLWDHRSGRLKDEPTIGAEEVPISEVVDDPPPSEPAEATGEQPAQPADAAELAPPDEAADTAAADTAAADPSAADTAADNTAAADTAAADPPADEPASASEAAPGRSGG